MGGVVGRPPLHARYPDPSADASSCRPPPEPCPFPFCTNLACRAVPGSRQDIKGLHDIPCKTDVNMIKGKTSEEVHETFNIKNDFTEEEEAEVTKRTSGVKRRSKITWSYGSNEEVDAPELGLATAKQDVVSHKVL
ncbi:hypothetical protein GH733_016151 [Mirounga leonina]|nr:hypothetical protein GH733_016151 [Mirounga leonina]